ncbi:MAG: permease-like cell division protein FtsX [Clostridia bacterium]|nr:permease-like cell division protein FtsX [Clostridia bacterium]
MKFSVIGYLIGEGFRNVFKNLKSTLACLGIMCATMVIFGIFFAIIENINHAIQQVEGTQAMEVFILKGTSDDRIKELGEQILALEGVNTIKFKSEEDAKTQMKQKFSTSPDLIDSVTMFKPSYVVTFTDITLMKTVRETVNEFDDVASIQSSQDTVNKLISIANGIKITSIVILVLLVAISIFIISNTIKLTVHARRKEISIMKYVGATNSFIRWPFIVEGIIIGVVAGLISILIVGGLYNFVTGKIVDSSLSNMIGISLLEFREMFTMIIIVYSILGIGIGILGSGISMRKYLEV